MPEGPTVSLTDDTAVGVDDVELLYGESYYRNCCSANGEAPYERSEHWLNFFGGIAKRIVQDLKPSTSFDAGCAIGLLVEQLGLQGVDARGVDVSEFAMSQVPEAIAARCFVGSLADHIPGTYDVVTCIEVMEHLQSADIDRALDNICAITDTVLFSSTPFDYGEATHFNVKQSEEWSELFAVREFFRDLDYDASYLTDWAVLYRRRPMRVGEVVREYDRKLARLRAESTALRGSVVALQTRNDELDVALRNFESGALAPVHEPALSGANGDALRARADAVDAHAADRQHLDEGQAELIAAKLQLLACRDIIAGLEARMGVVLGERNFFESHAASREGAVAELQAMHNARSWKLLSALVGPYRRFRARRSA